jgi:uncharacterized protein YijF (DUF1287 family)
MHRRHRRLLTIALGLTAATLVIVLISTGIVLVNTTVLGPLVRPDRNAHRSLLTPPERLTPFQATLVGDLERQVNAKIVYRDGYYMGGDPPPKIGVCSDVVVRSYRAAGVDLQRAVNADIKARSSAYDVDRPDRNIDHRRCRNLIVYFKRHARSLPTARTCTDWQPGDVVFWDTSGDGAVHHTGVIANGRDGEGLPTVVHHWPGMPVSETNGLFNWPIVGHFRWTAAQAAHANEPRGHHPL